MQDIAPVFENRKASHGVIVKTYSVVNLAVKEVARRYSPAEVVALTTTPKTSIFLRREVAS